MSENLKDQEDGVETAQSENTTADAADNVTPQFSIVYDDLAADGDDIDIELASSSEDGEADNAGDDSADDTGDAQAGESESDALTNDANASATADHTTSEATETTESTDEHDDEPATEGSPSAEESPADTATAAAWVAAASHKAATETPLMVASTLDKELRNDDAITFKSYPVLALKHVPVPDNDDFTMECQARRLYVVTVSSDKQRVAVMGLLSGLSKPAFGKVMFKSQELHELEPGEFRGHFVGVIPQRHALRSDISAVNNLVLAMEASGRNFLKAKSLLAADLLEKVGFPDKENDTRVRDLPEFEQRLVAIARAISCEASVVIADEPTGGLNDEESTAIMQLLRGLARRDDRSVIIVTRDPQIAELADAAFAV